MEANFLAIIVGTGGVVGLIGGVLTVINYLSKSEHTIRDNKAKISQIEIWEMTIQHLQDELDKANKKIELLDKRVDELEAKNTNSEDLIKKYKLILDAAHKCQKRRKDTDTCTVILKAKELGIE